MAVLAGTTPISALSELVSMGTLLTFVIVCAGVIILRRTRPDLPRPFRTPGSPVVPLLGVATCAYLMTGLPGETWVIRKETFGSAHSRTAQCNPTRSSSSPIEA